MSTYDVAVVGGGPAGLAAAMYAGLRGLSAAVFEAGAFGGQLVNLYPSKPVTNFPAQPKVASRELALRLAEQATRFGAELHEWQAVDDAGPVDDHYKLRAGGRDEKAQALVLALGLGRFKPRRLGIDREEEFNGKGLAYRLPPIEDIRVGNVVIVGGGDTALDTALSLHQVTHVTVVHRRDEFRAFAHTRESFEKAGIDVITNAEVVELSGNERLEAIVVSLADEKSMEIPADLVLVSIGQVPDLSGIGAWGLGISGPQIAVDSSMQTGLPGVFAVGDFAAYPGKVKMIATAAAEGSTAAAAAERYLMTPRGR